MNFPKINIKQVLYAINKVTKKTRQIKNTQLSLTMQNTLKTTHHRLPDRRTASAWTAAFNTEGRHGRGQRPDFVGAVGLRRNGRFRLELELTSFRTQSYFVEQDCGHSYRCRRRQCSNFSGNYTSAKKLGLTILAARKLFR